MKKLSLLKILKEWGPNVPTQEEIDDFSAQIEGDDSDYGHQTYDTTPVQQMWGGQPLPDDPGQFPRNAGDVYAQHNITQQDMERWIDQARDQGFTPELYKDIQSRVGDVENFMMDLQEVMPSIFELFVNAGLLKAQPKLQTNPNAAANMSAPKNRMNKQGGKNPLSLQAALNSAGQASWEELNDRGKAISQPVNNAGGKAQYADTEVQSDTEIQRQMDSMRRQQEMMAQRQAAQAQQQQRQQIANTPRRTNDEPTKPGIKIRRR